MKMKIVKVGSDDLVIEVGVYTLDYNLERRVGFVDSGSDANACEICGGYHFDGLECTQKDFDRIWGKVIEVTLEAVGVDAADGVYEVKTGRNENFLVL